MSGAPGTSKLSPHDIVIAKRMLARGMRLRYIANHFGVQTDTVKRHIDPGWWERRKLSNNARRRGEYRSISAKVRQPARAETPESRNPKYDPRRDEAPVYRNEFSQMLGEPPVGRSALDALNLSPRDPKEDRSSFADRAFGCPE